VFDQIIRAVREDPLLLLGVAFLLSLFVFALAKRLLKMALFAAVFFAVYLGLLYLLGEPMPNLPFGG
jgi:hypothetical protein